MQLPDVEALTQELAQKIKPHLTTNSALVGIHTGGVWLAQALHAKLGTSIPLGALDISFYRDDFSREGLHPEVKPSDMPFDVTDRDVILVDDVLYTGRTVRAAINELFDYGRPASIQLVVLVDRGGRELPFSAQFVGFSLPLEEGQNIQLIQDEHGKLTLELKEVIASAS